jgi:hypothetical protein
MSMTRTGATRLPTGTSSTEEWFSTMWHGASKCVPECSNTCSSRAK